MLWVFYFHQIISDGNLTPISNKQVDTAETRHQLGQTSCTSSLPELLSIDVHPSHIHVDTAETQHQLGQTSCTSSLPELLSIDVNPSHLFLPIRLINESKQPRLHSESIQHFNSHFVPAFFLSQPFNKEESQRASHIVNHRDRLQAANQRYSVNQTNSALSETSVQVDDNSTPLNNLTTRSVTRPIHGETLNISVSCSDAATKVNPNSIIEHSNAEVEVAHEDTCIQKSLCLNVPREKARVGSDKAKHRPDTNNCINQELIIKNLNSAPHLQKEIVLKNPSIVDGSSPPMAEKPIQPTGVQKTYTNKEGKDILISPLRDVHLKGEGKSSLANTSTSAVCVDVDLVRQTLSFEADTSDGAVTSIVHVPASAAGAGLVVPTDNKPMPSLKTRWE